MLVQDAITSDVIVVGPDATLARAEELMHRGRFRHLPVVEDGRVVGVLSEREVRPPTGMRGEDADRFSARRVTEVMRAPVIVVSPTDTIEDAAGLLFLNKIGCLPVVSSGSLVGIITTSDVFAAFLRLAGMTEPSTRVELIAADLPATLVGVGEAAHRAALPIAGLMTERAAADAPPRLVVRFATLQRARVVAALRAEGLTVVEPQPQPGS